MKIVFYITLVSGLISPVQAGMRALIALYQDVTPNLRRLSQISASPDLFYDAKRKMYYFEQDPSQRKWEIKEPAKPFGGGQKDVQRYLLTSSLEDPSISDIRDSTFVMPTSILRAKKKSS